MHFWTVSKAGSNDLAGCTWTVGQRFPISAVDDKHGDTEYCELFCTRYQLNQLLLFGVCWCKWIYCVKVYSIVVQRYLLKYCFIFWKLTLFWQDFSVPDLVRMEAIVWMGNVSVDEVLQEVSVRLRVSTCSQCEVRLE